MARIAIILILTAACAAAPALAQNAAQPPDNSQSMADYARKLQQEKQKASQARTTPAKVYTNDDIQHQEGSSGVTTANAPPAETGPATGAEPGAEGNDAKHFRQEYGKLLARKQLHERQLDVLNQKLAQANVQWYPNPNKELEQESTPKARSDINQLNEQASAKKLEIEKDDQAISDLHDQLRRAGGDESWLRESAPGLDALAAEKVPKPETNSKDQKQTKDYWQARFRPARENVKRATEIQKLVQDEVNLLQKRQVTELAPDAQADIAQKLAARQAELSTANSDLDKAQKVLDDLQKEFDASGAPRDWSVTD